jgi:type I restriction enzyme S subunit
MRKKYVQHSQQGASIVRRNLNKDDLLDDEIEIPPLPEQKKIAEILSGIDNRIGTAENQAQYYSVLLDSISHDSFSRKAIETVTLGEIAEFKSGRAFKSEELSEDGMKVTRISNLHKPYFPYWRYNGEYNPSIISRDGDILFSWAGVANSINVHRYKGEDTLLNQHIYNFDFCDPLLKEWTYWTLKNMLPKLRASIEGGAGQLHLTKGFIQSLPIPIFESRRMESLCKCFQSLENLENKQKILSTRLGALKNALSCDLLSGRKRVSV